MSISATSLFSANLSPKIEVGGGKVANQLIPTSNSTVEADFLKEAQKTPAERMHEALLKKLGVTEEQYAAMDDDQKAAIDEAVKQEIKQQIQSRGLQQTGNYTDMLA